MIRKLKAWWRRWLGREVAPAPPVQEELSAAADCRQRHHHNRGLQDVRGKRR